MESFTETDFDEFPRYGHGLPFVFVHGFGCSKSDWDAQLRYFMPGRECIAVDMPGHGDEAVPDGAITIEGMAEAVRSSIVAAGMDKVVLVGHSLGTKVIREAFLQNPKAVFGLGFIDGSTYSGSGDQLSQAVKGRIEDLGFAAFLDRMFEDMFVPGTDLSLRDGIVRRARRIDPEFGERLLLASIRWDLAKGDQSLARIDVPTTLIQTTFFKPGVGRLPLEPGMQTPFMIKIASNVRHSRVLTIPEVGHFPMFEAANEVCRILEANFQ
jgi:pimeloyl-ACP methyl ester carboxylesterase